MQKLSRTDIHTILFLLYKTHKNDRYFIYNEYVHISEICVKIINNDANNYLSDHDYEFEQLRKLKTQERELKSIQYAVEFKQLILKNNKKKVDKFIKKMNSFAYFYITPDYIKISHKLMIKEERNMIIDQQKKLNKQIINKKKLNNKYKTIYF